MDPNRIIQALRGTIDPNLRIAAENELNQVVVRFFVCVFFGIMGRFWPRKYAGVRGGGEAVGSRWSPASAWWSGVFRRGVH